MRVYQPVRLFYLYAVEPVQGVSVVQCTAYNKECMRPYDNFSQQIALYDINMKQLHGALCTSPLHSTFVRVVGYRKDLFQRYSNI